MQNANNSGKSNKDSYSLEKNYLEIYGFSVYLSSFFILILLMLWAFVPVTYIERVGITYYPQKQWTLNGLTILFYTFIIYYLSNIGYVLYKNPSEESVESLIDTYYKHLITIEKDDLYLIEEYDDKNNHNHNHNKEENVIDKDKIKYTIYDVPLTDINKEFIA